MEKSPSRDPVRVRRMFSVVARRYDLVNHVLSASLDRRWRRAAAHALPLDGSPCVLDLCGGTGDLAIELLRSRRAGHVVCCDFTHMMLILAGSKLRRLALDGRCLLLEADGLLLPFGDSSFDAVTVGFGVRNFVDLECGLREIHRILRPSGCLVVLEFSAPQGPVLSPLYRFYLRHVLPRLGRRISGATNAYGYLAQTIAGFPKPDVLAGRIRESGFAACGWRTLTGGIVAIHTAFRGRA